MICPKCHKAEMVLTRIEHREDEVVYVYVCPRCGHRLEESFKKRKLKKTWEWDEKLIAQARV